MHFTISNRTGVVKQVYPLYLPRTEIHRNGNKEKIDEGKKGLGEKIDISVEFGVKATKTGKTNIFIPISNEEK